MLKESLHIETAELSFPFIHVHEGLSFQSQLYSVLFNTSTPYHGMGGLTAGRVVWPLCTTTSAIKLWNTR